MCRLDPIVSSGVEVDDVAFDQFWNVLFLFSGFMLSIRSFFAIVYFSISLSFYQ